MKHAGKQALDRLDTLLDTIRSVGELKEKSRGVFYRGGRAFLHFHEHGDALFADIRFADEFERFEVTNSTQRKMLTKNIRATLTAGKSGRTR